jgi:hypothetical protein
VVEVLVSFKTPIADETGTYQARAVGRATSDKRWEAWLEFAPLDGEEKVFVTPIESRQPEREHLVYWATGLTPVYLEGALRRARTPPPVRALPVERAASTAPAPRLSPPSTVVRLKPEAVLDPFNVGSRSLDLLRQQLTALNRPRLLNIIEAHDLNPAAQDLSPLSDVRLIGLIVAQVEARLGS